ncbi:MAG: cysteine-rich CWC family protein [Bacteroidota bacterium]
MPQHETRKCPRCTKNFECKVGNIAECQCSQVSLTHEERVFIEEKYIDCLCSQCLQTMQFQYKLYRNHIFRF